MNAHVALFEKEKILVYGFSLGGDLMLATRIRLVSHVTYARSERDTSFGLATLSWWGASVGPDLLVVADPELRVGQRLSVAQVSGHGQSVIGVAESRQRGSVILGSGIVQLHVPLGGPLWLQTGLELGATLMGVEFTAGGHSSLNISGLFSQWNAGLAVAL